MPCTSALSPTRAPAPRRALHQRPEPHLRPCTPPCPAPAPQTPSTPLQPTATFTSSLSGGLRPSARARALALPPAGTYLLGAARARRHPRLRAAGPPWPREAVRISPERARRARCSGAARSALRQSARRAPPTLRPAPAVRAKGTPGKTRPRHPTCGPALPRDLGLDTRTDVCLLRVGGTCLL